MKAVLCLALLASPAAADTISLDPVMGALGFTGKSLGDWSVSYERTLAPHHALVLEQTTVHVHDDPFHLTNYGLGVGYRYFLRESGSSAFFGGFVGAKLGTGRYDVDDHDLTAHAAYGTAHVGWRWVMNRFAITTRIGAGYAYYHVETSDHDHDVMAEDRLLPLEIDGELAIGWQF